MESLYGVGELPYDSLGKGKGIIDKLYKVSSSFKE